MLRPTFTFGSKFSALLILVLLLTSCQPIQPMTEQAADPTLDRVGFPENYQTDYPLYYEFDRPDNKTARLIYANEVAASVQAGQAYPNGSVLVMEVYRTKKDEAGNVLLDEAGRYQRDEMSGIFVMRKERGFGAKYQDLRNGDWEYVAYKTDKTFLTPPERTAPCAACHMEAGMGKDWVFGAHRAAAEGGEIAASHTATNSMTINNYLFSTNVLTVPVGTEVTWLNNDVVFHTVTANDLSFSGMLRPHASARIKFEKVGEVPFFCAVHTSMKGTIVVTEN